VKRLKGRTGSVRAVAFSPDSKLVVSASHYRTVMLWGAATGAVMKRLKGHSVGCHNGGGSKEA